MTSPPFNGNYNQVIKIHLICYFVILWRIILNLPSHQEAVQIILAVQPSVSLLERTLIDILPFPACRLRGAYAGKIQNQPNTHQCSIRAGFSWLRYFQIRYRKRKRMLINTMLKSSSPMRYKAHIAGLEKREHNFY